MKIAFSKRAIDDYDSLSGKLKLKADKQFSLLLKNFRHPSIKTKKYNEALDIWQGRIDRSYRFYFKFEGGVVFIVAITKHPK